MANHMSMYSNATAPGGRNINPAQQSSQVSTTTLLNAIHSIYTSSQPYQLDASTSLVVNTWLTATQHHSAPLLGLHGSGTQRASGASPSQSFIQFTPQNQDGGSGGIIDAGLAARAWEHARRRAEDGCIVLGSLHHSTPSILIPFLTTLPLSIPSSLYTSLNALRPFIHTVSPYNHSTPRQSALGVTLTFSLDGNLTGASLALSQGGIDTAKGLLSIPAEQGYRAFDVFYYLLTSASTPAEREFLGLKEASSYALLSRSSTYEPPSYLPAADDEAAAEDFRGSLKAIGIKGSAHRNLISVLAGLLKLGDTLTFDLDRDALEEVCEDVGGLLGLEPDVLADRCSTSERATLIGGLYEALVDWVLLKANEAIASEMSGKDGDSLSEAGMRTPKTDEDEGDSVTLTVIEISDPVLGKAVAMRGVFDDTQGINAEMKEDGVDVTPAGSSVLREMENAVAEVAPDLGIMTGPQGRERERERERREAVLEKVGHEGEDFLKKILFPVDGEGVNLGRAGRIDLPAVIGSSRVWYHLSLHPTDDLPATLATVPNPTSVWSAGAVSRQLRSWRLPEWANRRNKNLDFTADFDHDEFCQRYAPLGCKDGRDGIESWILEHGWSNGEVVIGSERIWMRESAWWEAESMLDMKPNVLAGGDMSSGGMAVGGMAAGGLAVEGLETGYSGLGSGYFGQPVNDLANQQSREPLIPPSRTPQSFVGGRSLAPTRNVSGGDYGLGFKGDDKYRSDVEDYLQGLDPEIAQPKSVVTTSINTSRRIWIAVVWALTFWIPSFLLRYVGRMKRPDVRMAWREKVVLVFGIFLLNATIIFYIVEFGKLLCPNYDKAWNASEVATHQGDDDFWVSIRGKVYNLSKFWKITHGTTTNQATSTSMQPLAGLNLDEYFVPPLNVACPGLGIADTIEMTANTTAEYSDAVHTSGYFQADTTSALANQNWYWDTFKPAIQDYYHGELVVKRSTVESDGQNNNHEWVILNGKIYDLTDYFYTIDTIDPDVSSYAFLDSSVSDLVKKNPGTDITDLWEQNYQAANASERVVILNNLNCLNEVFYVGTPDFRQSARCQVNNYILLSFTIILCVVIVVKFVSALRFGSKKKPAQQDKFVICQVPAYTEGEESLRKALDSLTALQYDNKRKLIYVICDGMVVGGGNDRPTPKIVLDILGVDPKMDPPALPFHSVGESNEQLNYGKIYSGLYEYEGNVIPYVVVVKVGKESEQSKSKPGNRGKRDSQILLMSFLNRVHHRSPMNPLELEMFHQINNIIGVDPELYEYLLMIDADTAVREDSLNRLVAKCANDNKIAGICGETTLENEEKSWWTMIQVYEYFISHHLAKAFESLFGSVTCLPGCFTMYRLRTADKGKPLIISDAVIRDYSECVVDTLHKKNLLSLGEDRFLTTLMTRHFPYMSYKFIPDAYASTAAPESWSVLLSQRRRWVNSTIHNLAELVWLKDLCGFCCFSMRFVVFVDLFGTIILPATTVYLGYLLYLVGSHKGQFPLISIIMLAATYGFQAVIFLLKRQWQHIGWMIIYLLAFPIYSFVLPVYSFWNQDNFSWGNTRIVIGEKGSKQVIALEDEGFDPRSIPLQRWDDYAAANNLPGRRGVEKFQESPYEDTYEMDDMDFMSSMKPASILTGFPGRHQYAHIPPSASPAPFQQSVYSNMDAKRHQSVGQSLQELDVYQDYPPHPSTPHLRSNSDNIYRPATQSPSHMSQGIPLGYSGGARTPMGYEATSRPVSTFDFQRTERGPDDMTIVEAIRGCLMEVDLDSVTKKQVRALVEQRLQTELLGERRTFMDRMIDVELANM